MSMDLTSSLADRQKILNNPYAISELQKATQINGVIFEDSVTLVKEQIADFFEVDV